jgi:hypothetical protein
MGLFDSKKDKERYDARLSQILGRPLPPQAQPAVLSPEPAIPDTLAASPAPAATPWQLADALPESSGVQAYPVAVVVAEPVPVSPRPTSPPETNGAHAAAPESAGEAAPPPPASAILFFPPAPERLEETGLTAPFIHDHLLRTLYFAQQITGGQLADECGLPFPTVIGPQLDVLRKDQFVEVRGQRGIGDAGYLYGLTAKGTARALEALQKTQYRGPLPVPWDRYVASIKAQTLRHVVVTEENIRQAFKDLILHEEILEQVGPAVNSASAMFLFGYPGNGKTSIAERITDLLGDAIYIPYAVEVDGYIVKLFDLLVHEPVGRTAQGQDGRWVRVQRPTVVAGGELTMASLDLLWSDIGRFYEAPLQMKANGGMFLIDDFGRQMMRPQDLLNRWIVPLEKRIDFLTLVTGKKIQVPFDQLIVFSTNLDPKDLVDDAFLRRIKFKIDVKDPSREHFAEIMRLMCRVRNVAFHEGGLNYMLDKWWTPLDRPLRMCQPRDILDQMIAIAKYKQVEPDLANAELIDRACATYFVSASASSPRVGK